MQLANDMMANMHKMYGADVALTHAQGHAAPTGGYVSRSVFTSILAKMLNKHSINYYYIDCMMQDQGI
jgi:hypothetical protein